MATRGIHIVWTTYMTWLPGDQRGHWSPMFDMYGRLCATGHRINLPDTESAAHARAAAVDPPMVLKPAQRVVVAHELSQHVRWPTHSPRLAGGTGGGRGSSVGYPENTKRFDKTPESLESPIPPGKPGAICGKGNAVQPNDTRDKPVCHAAAIEDNHVHLLFGPISEDLGKFIGRLKGRTSSVLRKLPANTERKRVWTSGYWKVFLFDDDAMGAVARYIGQHNQRRGLDATPYDWVTPLPT